MAEIAAPMGQSSVPRVERAVGTRWADSKGKRLFDFAVAVTCLVIAAPILAVCAILIRFSSPGPVLFRQTRVGRDGHLFEVFKLRTMRVSESSTDSKVTYAGDGRITAVGRFLRTHKLDELPQLVNVLLGDMSLVGPRPLVPEQTAHVFPCRPGVTGVGSLAFRNQEQVLRLVHPAHISRVHAEVLTERRIETEREYLLNSSLWSDLDVILQSALAVCGLMRRTRYDLDVRAMIVAWVSRADHSNTANRFRVERPADMAAETAIKPRVRAAGA